MATVAKGPNVTGETQQTHGSDPRTIRAWYEELDLGRQRFPNRPDSEMGLDRFRNFLTTDTKLEGVRLFSVDFDSTLASINTRHPVREGIINILNRLNEVCSGADPELPRLVINTGRTLDLLVHGYNAHGGVNHRFEPWRTAICETGTRIFHRVEGDYIEDKQFVEHVLALAGPNFRAHHFEQIFDGSRTENRDGKYLQKLEAILPEFVVDGHPFRFARVPIPNTLLAQFCTRAPEDKIKEAVDTLIRPVMAEICPNAIINVSRDMAKGVREVKDGDVVPAGTSYIDITPAAAGKLNAMMYLAQSWGIPLSECAHIGDSGNDRPGLAHPEVYGTIAQNAAPAFKREMLFRRAGIDPSTIPAGKMHDQGDLLRAAISEATTDGSIRWDARREDHPLGRLRFSSGREIGFSDGLTTASVLEAFLDGRSRMAKAMLFAGLID